MEAEQFTLYSVADYLELEELSEVKHEYLGGTIHAMSGAWRRHNEIAGNVYRKIIPQLSGGPCKTYIEGVKVHIRTEVSDFFYYPDVVIGCDPSDSHEQYLEKPSIIFEVTSPGTESTDRREKLLAYQTLESLNHYLIVSQDQMRVEWLRRAGDHWEVLKLTKKGDCIDFVEPEARLSLEEIYEGIVFDPVEE